MLKGFRWQFIILICAVVLLGAAILIQPLLTDKPSDTTPPPTDTLAPTEIIAPTPIPPEQVSNLTEFHEGVVGDVYRLNPLFAAANKVDRDIVSLIFEGLVGTNSYGEYIPKLAESWTVSSDGLEYVFRLRQDVRWQDGIMFSASDVATTISFLQSPGAGLPDSLTTFWRTTEVEILDEFTVRFRLAQPLASFLDQLRIGILPSHVFEGLSVSQLADHPFNLTPIGTGPYQIEGIQTDETGISSVSLRVAPVYRQRIDGQSGYALERVVFDLFDSQEDAINALSSGTIDGVSGVQNIDLSAFEQAGILQQHTALEPKLGVLLFNWESEHTNVLRDYRVREALFMGADRVGLVNRYLSNMAIPANSPFIAGSWATIEDVSWPAYDPVRAQERLSTITFPADPPEPTPIPTAEEGEPTPTPAPTATPIPDYDFAILSANTPEHTALANELAEQWTQLGLIILTEAVSPSELRSRLDEGDFDVVLVELDYGPSADPDPYTFWHQGQYPDGQNYSGINDRRSSEMLEQARRDPNGLHRAGYYADFQQLFASRTLAMPLYYPVYTYATRADLEGLQIGFMSSATDRFDSIGSWTVSE